MGNVEGVNTLLGAFSNLIGGTTPAARNVISGNIDGFFAATGATTAAQGNVIQGNYVGLNAAGTAAIPNTEDGIDPSSFDTVGGTDPGAGNVISGNGRFGMFFQGSDIVVQGNLIGTDATGSAVLGNISGGILMSNTTNNLIGGPIAAARNVISGSAGFGIEIAVNFAHDNVVQGNYIGTDATGSVAFGNGDGILIIGSSNTIGGRRPGQATSSRATAATASTPVDYVGIGPAANNLVQGNYIGTNAVGTGALATASVGVFIGQPGYGAPRNRSADPAIAPASAATSSLLQRGAGVAVVDAQHRKLDPREFNLLQRRPRRLTSATMVTLNDTGDPDTGPNNLQNFPVLTPAAVAQYSGGTRDRHSERPGEHGVHPRLLRQSQRRSIGFRLMPTLPRPCPCDDQR